MDSMRYHVYFYGIFYFFYQYHHIDLIVEKDFFKDHLIYWMNMVEFLNLILYLLLIYL
jgi:hypothetical protein